MMSYPLVTLVPSFTCTANGHVAAFSDNLYKRLKGNKQKNQTNKGTVSWSARGWRVANTDTVSGS